MIVTSLPRSGSTKFCSDLAIKLNLPLHDEIFEYELAGDHKEKLHLLSDTPQSPKDIIFVKSLDFTKCVINNHEISFFTLEHTDLFVSRRNVQDSIWSWITYIDQYFDVYMPRQSINGADFESRKLQAIRGQLERMFKRTQYFYEYCIATNKEIIIPDLEYQNNKDVREKFTMFNHSIIAFKNRLVLPKGFVYE
jgi:hypothetical protein